MSSVFSECFIIAALPVREDKMERRMMAEKGLLFIAQTPWLATAALLYGLSGHRRTLSVN
jgi:hypothetical protein